MSYKAAFTQYIYSSKAPSYIKALDLLGQMLMAESYGFADCKDIWSVYSVNRLHDLYVFVLSERKKGDASGWNIEGIPKSYLQDGFCSAALRSYIEFIRDYSSKEIEEDIEEVLQDFKIKETEKSTLISARIGQGKFRSGLIDYWNGCAATGFRDTRFLVASHIKPWRDSENDERLDQYNGLLLLPNIDKAFDLGFVSFNQQGDILFSSELEYSDALGLNLSMSLKLCDRHREYMGYHRDVVFRG